MLQKIVFAGAHQPSFASAAVALEQLADLTVSTKAVERLTQRIGTERCRQRDEQARAYHARPLIERKGAPEGVEPPQVATVMVDGGRLQILDRTAREATEQEGPPDITEKPQRSGHWREDKIGLLICMESTECSVDPTPEIPRHFVSAARMFKLAREIHSHVPSGLEAPEASPGDAALEVFETHHYKPPKVMQRSVVATRQRIHPFGRLLSAEVWQQGFYQAERRAFVADGLECNWTLWQRHFSSFEPIVDFIHVLSYVFAAAMAGRSFEEGWDRYESWIQWVWAGKVEWVIAEMEPRSVELGAPGPDEPENSPATVVAGALGYLRNQQRRMRYDEYRRRGLPITSCHVESTIKRINQRVKGTEKFWSEDGAEAILQIRADTLSDNEPLDEFWKNRQNNETGQRRYRRCA